MRVNILLHCMPIIEMNEFIDANGMPCVDSDASLIASRIGWGVN